MSTNTVRKSPFFIAPPEDYEWIKAMIYGDTGAGKTYFAASAHEVPEMRDVLFIDAEAGAKTLRKFREQGLTDVIRIQEFMQLARIHEYLRKHCTLRDAGDDKGLLALEKTIGLEREKPAHYKTVVIDSLSELQRLNMYQLLDVKVGVDALDDIPESPEFQHWHKTTEMTRMVVRAFRNLPLNVIMVSAQKESDDKGRKVGLAFPNQLASELPGFFDMLGYLEAQQAKDDKGNPVTVRRLNLVASTAFKAKHRFGEAVKAPFLVNATMKDVFALNQGKS